MKPPATTYLKLTKRLSQYRRRTLLVIGSLAFSRIVLFSSIVLLVLAFCRWMMQEKLSLSLASLFFYSAVLGCAFYFLRPFFRKALQPYQAAQLEAAAQVGALLQGINDRLVNALQLFEQFERDKGRYSPSLMEAALTKTADDLEGVDFRRLVETRAAKRALLYAAFVIALNALVSIGIRPLAVNMAFIAQPWKAPERQAVRFIVHPGDAVVIKGRPIVITAWASDSTLAQIILTLKQQSRTERLILQKADDDSFRYTLQAVRDSLVYFVAAGPQRSRLFHISVIERPMLKNLQVQVKPPAYSKLPAYTLEENIGDVTALRGSAVELTAVASIAPERASICFSDSSRLPMTLKGRRMTAAFRLEKEVDYRLEFVDSFGNTNDAPLTYRLRILPDAPPVVQILSPAQDINLGDDMTIPLLIEAQDDYGISRLQLAYQIVTGGEGEADSAAFSFLPIETSLSGSSVRVNLNWNVNDLDMFPTDVLYFFVRAFDNDQVGGPKSGKSAVKKARFPSLYEMYQEITSRQEEATDVFEQVRQKTRDLRQKAEQLSMQLKRDQGLDWQRKNELESVLQKQEEIREQIAETARQLEETAKQIERRDLFSAETMKKFEEIRELYEQILTPELEKALERMREAMERLDQETINRAMQELMERFEEYDKALDRTIALLKQLKLQQQIEQAQKIAQDLAEREEKISRDVSQSSDRAKLKKEQEQINTDAAQLEKTLQELDEQLGKSPSPLHDALQELSSPKLKSTLNRLADAFQEGRLEKASQDAAEAAESFESVAGSLAKMSAMMSGEMQRRALEAMRKTSRDLLALSQQQENLMLQSRQLARNSAAFPETAERQAEIKSALQRVAEETAKVMKENFGIQSQVSSSMGKAMRQMDEAIRQLEARDQRAAAQRQQEALAALNEAVRRLQTSMQAMMQQGGGGGMSYQQFLQQMQQLGESQQRINQQTEELSSNPSFLGMQAAMSRLAAEQQQVRKSMETLAREAAGMREILGSLDKIAEDMKKVEEDLFSQQITRDTIQRQNRILSRMLDAQKSVNEREFSRERQAETAKAFTPQNAGKLPSDLGEHSDELRQNLLRAKQEGFSRDYLQIIEQYLNILIRNETEKP
ncbi:MAG: hypothetical protein ONB24_00285 [candidate division KSB1 bacterium]|nr:hypothetical protein [candidate division KSB1 bacterium]